jgi:hypothetical protein
MIKKNRKKQHHQKKPGKPSETEAAKTKGTKETEKETKTRNKPLEYNELAVPKQIPKDTTELNGHLEKFQNGLDNTFALNISFPHVRKSYGICEGRIILAVLRVLRNVVQFTKILPWKENLKSKPTADEEDIECNEKFTRQFLEDPKHTANDKYVTRIRRELK